MTIECDTIEAPESWASYLINGDPSGLEPDEIAACDDWQDSIAPWYVVSCGDSEPCFTWKYRLYGGTAEGGNVQEYIIHKAG